jgi:hypothetical protein
VPGTSGTVSLYLTLCYADCLTAPVPIPGEPCRSEDELMAPSRVADDFCLELRTEAPPQVEDDALRDFVSWLKENVQVVALGSPPADEAQWLGALRGAVQAWRDAIEASPPMLPPDYLADLTTPVSMPLDQLRDFRQVAFRFWVTELRPMWMARRCHAPTDRDQDCLLLARVEVPVEWVGGSPTGAWVVDGSAASVNLDESTRPFIVHARLLQEWMLLGGGGVGSVSGLPQGLPPRNAPAFAGMTLAGSLRLPFTTTSTNIALDDRHHFVVCTEGVRVTLPKCAAGNLGRVYNIRTSGANSTLVATDNDTIVGGPTVTQTNPKIVVSDGNSTWYVF